MTEKRKTKWKPGQSGNPKGRPKGTRDVLSKGLIDDFCTVWAESGIAAVRELARTDVSTFVRVAASLVPREAKITTHHLIEQVKGMTDEQLNARIRTLNSKAGTVSANDGGGAEAEKAEAL